MRNRTQYRIKPIDLNYFSVEESRDGIVWKNTNNPFNFYLLEGNKNYCKTTIDYLVAKEDQEITREETKNNFINNTPIEMYP